MSSCSALRNSRRQAWSIFDMEERSRALFERALKCIPGGVNSPVRAARSVGMNPLFIAEARGAVLKDADGKEYLDYVCSWGPMILGHGREEVIAAVKLASERGTSYGAPTEAEVEMAETICRMVPSVEMVRMVNSGTEAVMSAVRLARGFTGRDLIVKFDGCYHGHADSVLVSAGSGLATLGIPGSPGVPADLARKTISIPYNDLEAVSAAFKKYGPGVAALIVEPVAGNMGVVLPAEGFLQGLREITSQYGSLLIFDEVITGFRLARGGAQELYSISPDLTCLGKIIGGGLPVGAYGGRRDIMERIAPQGDIYQAGTLSGNPLAMAAGLATLRVLEGEKGIYQTLERKGRRLFEGLRDAALSAGLDATVTQAGSMGTVFFTKGPVRDFASAQTCDTRLFRAFYARMRERGIYLAPSAYEAIFISLAHTDEMIDKTISCAREAMNLAAAEIC
jgi:glutamate-1-semialdehyde 2,1-aminomutase